MSLIIREARAEDTLAIQRFMTRAGLPAETGEMTGRRFLLAEDENSVIAATVALQPVAQNDALIRSLVIDPEKAGGGFLLNMLDGVMYYAWEHHVDNVYLMVKKAAEMLAALGFTEVKGEDLPDHIKEVKDVRTHLGNGLPVYKQSNPGDN